MQIVKMKDDPIARYELPTGESLSIYRCPISSGVFGVDSSWLVNDETGLMVSPFDANVIFDFDEREET